MTRGIGPIEGRNLLEAFGGATQVLAASVAELAEVLRRGADEVRRRFDLVASLNEI